jgi:uncharacterized cysteine cluster protein YcgN (CxxCxxCC family)
MVMFGWKRKRLHRKSLLLAEALQVFEDSLCRGCGQSSLLAYDPRNSGEWERLVTQCMACEELEKDDTSPELPGKVAYLHNHLSDGPEEG